MPEQLANLLEDRKEEERNAPRQPKSDEGAVEAQAAAAEMGAAIEIAAVGSSVQVVKVSFDDLCDGIASMMPTTCVDDLYELRSIKKVSARVPIIGNTINTAAVTPRLAP